MVYFCFFHGVFSFLALLAARLLVKACLYFNQQNILQDCSVLCELSNRVHLWPRSVPPPTPGLLNYPIKARMARKLKRLALQLCDIIQHLVGSWHMFGDKKQIQLSCFSEQSLFPTSPCVSCHSTVHCHIWVTMA